MPVQYGYRLSKTALNMAGKLLAEDLAAQQIPVGIIHPGAVRVTLPWLLLTYGRGASMQPRCGGSVAVT